LRYVKTESGWRRVGVKRNRRGEDLAVKSGETILERGGYQLRWYERKRARFCSAGDTIDDAEIPRDKKLPWLRAPDVAAAAGGTFVPEEMIQTKVILKHIRMLVVILLMLALSEYSPKLFEVVSSLLGH
jgi:hypothetical protein